jgi:hypothetical protein
VSWNLLLGIVIFIVSWPGTFPLTAEAPQFGPLGTARVQASWCPPNVSDRGGSKPSTDGKLRDLGHIPAGLSAFRPHPIIHTSMRERKWEYIL